MDNLNKFLVFTGVLGSFLVAQFYGLPAIVQALLILIALDMLFGFLIAWREKTISSHEAFYGATRKCAQLILIGMAGLLQPLLKLEIPLANVLAAYYVYVECLSILEHASKTGIPIPAFLRDALVRLNPDVKITNLMPVVEKEDVA